MTAAAVGSRNAAIGAPNQNVPKPGTVNDGGTRSGRSIVKAIAPTAKPAKIAKR